MPEPAHFLLIPVGSAGDVFPFLGLGAALKKRGHRVTLLTSGYFEEAAANAGLEFCDTLPREAFLRLTRQPKLWHPLHGARAVLKALKTDLLEKAYREIAHRFEPGKTVAVASCLAFQARIAHERLGIPLVTLDLQPFVLWTAYETSVIPLFLRARWVPRWFKNLQYRIAERLVVDAAIGDTINAFRMQLDMPPVPRITQWWHSPQMILGLFPEWFAARQPDWPRQLHLTQFPLWNADVDKPLPSDVEQFLNAGTPPLVFTPGSANRFGDKFFRVAVEASQMLGRRAMLFTQFPEQLPKRLPESVQHFAYAPFHKLLPHVAALIHHGGIGTSAQALEAGVPQLIMPLAHDQPDNAHRVRKLGVGSFLMPRQFTSHRVAARINHLLTDPAVQTQLSAVAHRIQNVDPYGETCRHVESLVGKENPPYDGSTATARIRTAVDRSSG